MNERIREDLFVRLRYPLDKAILLESANRARQFAKPYTDDRYPAMIIDNLHLGHYTDEYIEKIISDFKVNGKPRFYWTKPHSVIPSHTDNNTQCSLNFILSDDPAPITFFSREYRYDQILLNTTIPHAVTNGATERILLKISIFDETYEHLSMRIGYKADNN